MKFPEEIADVADDLIKAFRWTAKQDWRIGCERFNPKAKTLCLLTALKLTREKSDYSCAETQAKALMLRDADLKAAYDYKLNVNEALRIMSLLQCPSRDRGEGYWSDTRNVVEAIASRGWLDRARRLVVANSFSTGELKN